MQPWSEYIEQYVKYLVDKVGGTQEAWTDIMSLSSGKVRRALYLTRLPPHKLPQEVSEVLQVLIDSLSPAYKDDTAKLTFALHQRPFYSSAMEKHVELVLWGIVSARNEWF